MSETEQVMEETAPGGKRSFKKLILIAIVLILLGGGGFYYWRSKSAAATENNEVSEKDEKSTEKKSKSKKSSDDSEEEAEDEEKPAKKSSSGKSSMPSDEDVKKVVELPPFIVNLADAENARYLPMTVSLGIGGEEGSGESEKPDQLFMTRVRNAMLAVLVEKKSDEILTVEGKAKLRKELLKAARGASEEPSVEAIYITDFIVQL